MLVLSRKKNGKIIIGGCIEVMVVEIRGDKVRLGITAPKDVVIHREEIWNEILRERGEIKGDGDRTHTRDGAATTEDRRPRSIPITHSPLMGRIRKADRAVHDRPVAADDCVR